MKKTLLGSLIILTVIFLAGCDYRKLVGKSTGKSEIGAEAAKSKVDNFIKESGGQATVKDAVEEDGLYKITVDAQGQELIAYVTLDGTKFFPQFVDMDETLKKIKDEKEKQAEAEKNMPKTDKPVVDLYVMSFCPYGNKAEDTLKPAYDLLKNKVDFNFYYIVTANGDNISSLHGQPEVDQNVREACVLKNNGKNAWMNFVAYVNANCGLDGKCWEAGAKAAGLSASAINSCAASQGTALMKANAEASAAAGASGSPTMFINGVSSKVVYQYGNSEAYKQAICGAFNTAPSECSKTLSSSTSTTEGGSCEN